jgi:hypothetical protein
MSFYNQSVSTQIIDAQFNQSRYRSEFRVVKDGLYSTAMRVLNIGLQATGDGRYNLLTGAQGVIKSIFLMDGRQVLDQVIDYNDFSAFNAYNHSNNENRDLYKALSKNGMGFVFDRQPVSSSELPFPQNPTLIKEDFSNQSHTPRTLYEETAMGFLNLREVFPLLKQLPLVSTQIFPNLRVVIEYDTSSSLIAMGVVLGTSLPLLVVDQIMNPQLEASTVSAFKSVVWSAVELESVVLPVAGAGTQSVKYRLNGFSNKTLMNVLVQKKGSTDVSGIYRSKGSITGFAEKFQLVINGSNLFPLDGIVGSNQRLALLHDTYNACNAHPASANLAMYNSDDFIDLASDRVGQTDWFGCSVNKPITSLEVQYSRDFVATMDARYSQALTLNVFGTVLKSIVKNPKGGYSVIYL